MQRRWIAPLLCLAFAAGCVVATARPRVAVPSAHAEAAPPRWAHRCVTVEAAFDHSADDAATRVLDELGAKGWQLVTATRAQSSDHTTYCLKRPAS